MFFNWNFQSDAILRIYIAQANGQPSLGATASVIIKTQAGVTLDSGPFAEVGSGYYSFALDPALTVEIGDFLKAEVSATGSGKDAYSELWIFVRVDND